MQKIPNVQSTKISKKGEIPFFPCTTLPHSPNLSPGSNTTLFTKADSGILGSRVCKLLFSFNVT